MRLDSSSRASFIHYSDVSSEANIATMDPEELRHFVPIQNKRVGSILWQRGALRAALDATTDACIFTGDVKALSTWAAATLARLSGKKVIFWTIGWHRPEQGIRRIIRLAFYRIAHRLMVYSALGKEHGIAHGYPGERIDVVYNSITDPKHLPIDDKNIRGKKPTLGAVARLYPAKNFDLLLDAVAQLKKRGRDIRIILAGAGPESGRLERQALQLSLDCEFLGPVHDPQDIEEFYRKIHLTVVPSAAGLTTIQSLAHGVPVVTDNHAATQGPEVAAIVNRVTGSSVEAGSVSALADEIDWWLDTLSNDSVYTAERCQNEVSERWSPEAQAQRILASVTH